MGEHTPDQTTTDDALAGIGGIELLGGVDAWHIVSTEQGIGIRVSDGPAGIRGTRFAGGPTSAATPCEETLAASFDVDLVQRVGAVLGAEARAKNAHVHLAPTINLLRHPLGGRGFECFGEDPALTSAMAVAYVRGVQSKGVGSCVKHLVANDSEFERMTISSEVAPEVLREVYLRPFEAALIEAGAWSVMSAYNRLGGTYCSSNTWLLTTVLRDQWGWDGTVISDWWGTHAAAESLAAGLDIEMPGPPRHRNRDKLAAGLAASEATAKNVDCAVDRIKLLAKRTGAAFTPGDAAAGKAAWRAAEPDTGDDPDVRAILRAAAAAGVVLLRNDVVGDAPVVPFSGGLGRVAVIGPNATALHAQGGGSAQITAPQVITPLDGLADVLGATGIEVVHAHGAPTAAPLRLDGSMTRTGDSAGLLLEEVRNGEVVRSVVTPGSRWVGLGGTLPDVVRYSGTLVDSPGALIAGGTLVVTCHSAVRVFFAEELVHEGAPAEVHGILAGGRVDVALPAIVGPQGLAFIVELPVVAGIGGSLGLAIEPAFDPNAAADAAALAAGSDAAVVVIGLDLTLETEGNDRAEYGLPQSHVDLALAVLAAQPRTVVVLNCGTPVDLAWAAELPAIAWIGCPGQEGGGGLADVLCGVVGASGRLPFTWPASLDQVASGAGGPTSYPGADGKVSYDEGLLVGHRWYEKEGLTPLFSFGHGLGLTTIEWGAPSVDGDAVTLSVTNTGSRSGRDIVQVYVAGPDAGTNGRPRRELAGFAATPTLAPGETAAVIVTLQPRSFDRWNEAKQQFDALAGEWTFFVARSAEVTDQRVTMAR